MLMRSPPSSPSSSAVLLWQHSTARVIAGLSQGEHVGLQDLLGEAGAGAFLVRVLAAAATTPDYSSSTTTTRDDDARCQRTISSSSGGSDVAVLELQGACLEALACLCLHHPRNQDALLADQADRLLLISVPGQLASFDGDSAACYTELRAGEAGAWLLLRARWLSAVAALAGEHVRAQDALGAGGAAQLVCRVAASEPVSCLSVQLAALRAASALACDHPSNQAALLG